MPYTRPDGREITLRVSEDYELVHCDSFYTLLSSQDLYHFSFFHGDLRAHADGDVRFLPNGYHALLPVGRLKHYMPIYLGLASPANNVPQRAELEAAIAAFDEAHFTGSVFRAAMEAIRQAREIVARLERSVQRLVRLPMTSFLAPSPANEPAEMPPAKKARLLDELPIDTDTGKLVLH